MGQPNFFGTAEKQVAEGYKWEYVGKTESWVLYILSGPFRK